MLAEVFSGNVARHLNTLEESTSSQLPCVWGREILQGRKMCCPLGETSQACIPNSKVPVQEMTPCQINSKSEVRDGGWKESLPHKWNLQKYRGETTTHSVWICPTPMAPRTSAWNILQTVDQHQGLPFMQALSDIQTIFFFVETFSNLWLCLWKLFNIKKA